MKDLSIIKGVGPKTIQLLNRLNLFTIDDLIMYYPFRYNLLKKTDLDSLNVVVEGTIVSLPIGFRIKRGMDRMSFTMNVNNMLVNVIIYNRLFLKGHLPINKEITVLGKYDKLKNTITASDIKLYKIGDSVRIESVYHTVSGLSNKIINNYVNEALNMYEEELEDYIPDYLNERYHFVDKRTAVIEVHNPKDKSMLDKSLKKLRYEELFIFMLKMNYIKLKQTNKEGIVRTINMALIEEFVKRLPFILTVDQMTVLEEVFSDMRTNKRMNRLIQGDVGGGKTIVAFLAVYANHLSKYQSVLMVPTEVLAIQHYNNAIKLFKDTNMNIELLVGSTPKKKKEEIKEKLLKGEIDFVIGTHALIVDDVKFNNLSLIITDEQHRFGVNQRAILKNKGVMPDILYLSATPIPRTYALTIYGDLDISNIKTRPKDRKEIITYLKSAKELEFVSQKMLEELKLGHQVFVIAPLIEENETSNLVDINKLKERMEKVFGKVYKVDMLHGKMKPSEKDEVLNKFKDNETKILISTTVIEVGIDIPNATMIVIFDAHQFGLATLHQLRGRVGRSDIQSYCILVSNHEAERLNIMTKTNDGFVISEEDFKLRGHGDLFGLKQSGDMIFKLADFRRDFEMLLQVKSDAMDYLQSHINENDKLINKTVNQLEKLD